MPKDIEDIAPHHVADGDVGIAAYNGNHRRSHLRQARADRNQGQTDNQTRARPRPTRSALPRQPTIGAQDQAAMPTAT